MRHFRKYKTNWNTSFETFHAHVSTYIGCKSGVCATYFAVVSHSYRSLGTQTVAGRSVSSVCDSSQPTTLRTFLSQSALADDVASGVPSAVFLPLSANQQRTSETKPRICLGREHRHSYWDGGTSDPWMAPVSLHSRVLGRKIKKFKFGAFFALKCILGHLGGAVVLLCPSLRLRRIFRLSTSNNVHVDNTNVACQLLTVNWPPMMCMSIW